MTKPAVHFTSLLDRAAFEHLQSKTLLPSFSHYDVWLYEHAVGFTVAKMMDADLLADTKAALEHAMQSGEPYHQFVKKMKPYLMARGWWGEQVMTDPVDGVAKTVQLGSTRRLRVIFQTNMATAYAAGQWARVQEDKREFPYLKYIASTAEQKRASHMAFYGRIWRVDDPIWQSIFPPNGYGCQCTVRQLTAKQALRERGEDISKQPENFTEQQKANHAKGIIDDGTDDIQWREFTNPRTGQTVKVPFDVTPSFAHNHSARLIDMQELAEQRHGQGFIRKFVETLSDYLHLKTESVQLSDEEIFSSSASIINEGKRLFETHYSLMKKAIKKGKPHEGIMEIMRREGVELGGDVSLKGFNQATLTEFGDIIKRYPKLWVDKSNEIGSVVVEPDNIRAFHLKPNLKTQRDFDWFKNTKKRDFQAFKRAFEDGLVKNGDSLIIAEFNEDLSKLDRLATHLHEFGHRLQEIMPELEQYFARLFNERTAQDEIQTLNEMLGYQHYDDDELGMRDDFPNEYYGKMYGKSRKDPQAHEMLTMTFQALLGGNVIDFNEIASKPDFLYFGLALLVRFKP